MNQSREQRHFAQLLPFFGVYEKYSRGDTPICCLNTYLVQSVLPKLDADQEDDYSFAYYMTPVLTIPVTSKIFRHNL